MPNFAALVAIFGGMVHLHRPRPPSGASGALARAFAAASSAFAGAPLLGHLALHQRVELLVDVLGLLAQRENLRVPDVVAVVEGLVLERLVLHLLTVDHHLQARLLVVLGLLELAVEVGVDDLLVGIV